MKLEIPEFVKFFNEKTISGPCQKVTSVFREKQYLFANQLATKNIHTLAGNIQNTSQWLEVVSLQGGQPLPVGRLHHPVDDHVGLDRCGSSHRPHVSR